MKSQAARHSDRIAFFKARAVVRRHWRELLPTDRVAILSPRGQDVFRVGRWNSSAVIKRLCFKYYATPREVLSWLAPDGDGFSPKIVKIEEERQ